MWLWKFLFMLWYVCREEFLFFLLIINYDWKSRKVSIKRENLIFNYFQKMFHLYQKKQNIVKEIYLLYWFTPSATHGYYESTNYVYYIIMDVLKTFLSKTHYWKVNSITDFRESDFVTFNLSINRLSILYLYDHHHI